MKIQQTNNIPNPGKVNSSKETWKVAREFEAIFIAMMMKSMRKTVFDGGLLKKNMGEKIYTDMLDQEYSKIISNNASFGLAEQIVKQIEGLENNGSMLRSLKSMDTAPWMIDNRFVPGQSDQQPVYKSRQPVSKRVAHWEPYIAKASKHYGIDKHLIEAVITQESAGNPYAVSRAGAKGLMQLINSTAASMGVSHVFNPEENIMGGTKYLNMLLKQFDGNETHALASYNAGPNAVIKYGGVPPYKETQHYVKRVLSLRESFHEQENKKINKE